MRAWLLPLLLLAGCARTSVPGAAYDVAPAVDDWGPHPDAPIEWWYVSSAGPQADLAFHVAFFRAPIPPERRVLGLPLHRLFPGTYVIADVAVTDLASGERYLRERTDAPFGFARAEGPPLRLELGPWALVEGPEPGRYTLRAGPLVLALRAEKPPTVHPPGWSGNRDVGCLAYQSITRLRYEGTWRGRAVTGTAWMDHQWGDLVPLRDARWDWHGLHLDDGTDLMLYDLTRPDGGGRCLHGTATDAQGVTRPLASLRLEPLEAWRSPMGLWYAVAWRAEIEGERLTIRPIRRDLEIATWPGIAYWEGPVVVEGRWRGRAVRGVGMGEHLPWRGPWTGATRPARPAPVPTPYGARGASGEDAASSGPR